MSYGIVLTDGTTTLDLRDEPIKCFNWFDLYGAPTKHGRNRRIPGQRGTAVRPRVAGQLRALLHVMVTGVDHDDVIANLDTLYELLDADETLTVTLHRGTQPSVSGTLQVEDPDRPTFRGTNLAVLVPEVTLPDGRLT